MSKSSDNNYKHEEATPMNSTGNIAKIDIHTWRKSVSFAGSNSPVMSRQELNQACRDRLVRTPTV
ncbi:unnamed protein product, partial [Rotaria sordida]